MTDKWDIASTKFLDYVNYVLENINDDRFVEESGKMLSAFSQFIVEIDKENGASFEKLYNFAIVVHELSGSGKMKLVFILKAIEILKDEFDDFYRDNEAAILQLFFEMVKEPIVNIDLLMRMNKLDHSLLAYPGYIRIQVSELERLAGYFDEDIDEVEKLMQKLKPGSKINRDTGI